MSDVVHFSDAPRVFAKADQLFAREEARIRAELPAAEIVHVGSTAIAGSLTKGDLDIAVRVSPSQFAEAERRLSRMYARNTGSDRNDVFSAFMDASTDPELGVQLVVIGSDYDRFGAWLELLRASAQLRREYDDLKRLHEGEPMDVYRAAKSQFIEARLGEPGDGHR